MLVPKRVVKAAVKFVSTDASRPALQGVHFPKAGTVEASDGHCGIRLTFQPLGNDQFPAFGGEFESPEGPCIVPPKPLLEALKAMPKRANMPVLDNLGIARCAQNGHGATVELRATDLDTRHKAETRAIEGPFPLLENVMPTAAPAFVIGFDARLLIRVLQGLLELGGADAPSGGACVRFEFHGPAKGALLRYQRYDVTATALVMPARMAE